MPMTNLETDLGADASANVNTLLSVQVGATAHGSIGVAGDHDFIAVTLEAGKTYTLAMVGIGSDILTDARLTLRGPDGVTELDTNDDGLQNLNAVIQFTASTTGTYYLDAHAFNTKTGSYGVSVTEGTKASFDAAMIAGAIDTHLRWSATRGTGTELTFGFSDTFTAGYTTFQHFTEAEKEVVRAVLAHMAEITNMTFTEVNPGGFTDEAVLLYGNYAADDGAGAWGGYPADPTFSSSSGNVWVNDANPPTGNIDFGTWFYAMMLHEVGHTMGLSHPGQYNAAVGVSITYAANAQFLQDSEEFTVMSYFDSDATGASDLNPDGFGLYDILALQQIYGANTTTRAEDTTYGFGSNAPRIYDFDANTTPKFSIWDGGGRDNIDASRFSADQVIDLGEGKFSDIGGYVRNISVAYGATLEDAKGGRGADTLIGNAVDNLLQGGDSDDSLTGGAGNDTLQGQGGADTLLAGAGNDLLQGENAGVSSQPQVFDLISTDMSANAKLQLTDTPLFLSSSFTLEMVWKQQSLDDEHYSADFGNLSIYRHADGTASLLFWDATEQDWLYGALPDALTDGDAHRLSITYEDATGILCVYLDGSETQRWQFTPGTRALSVSGDIVLDDDAAYGDIRLFDAARTGQEVWDNAWISLADPANTPHLIANWVGNAAGQMVSALAGVEGFTATGPVGHLQTALWSQGTGNSLQGGAGDDRYEVRSTADVVIEAAGQGQDSVSAFVNFTLGVDQEVEVLTVASGLSGLELRGNNLANRLVSAADATDTLRGGGGNDIFEVNSAQDRVIELTDAGFDQVRAFANFTLAAASAVEQIIASGIGLALGGNELANTLYSGAGADSLSGGAGNDVFYVNAASDRVIEAAGGGTDTVYTSAAFTLAAGSAVEVLRANSALALALGGNELANTLYSGAGADSLSGGAGNDVFYVNAASDRVIEAAAGGTDTVYASAAFTLAAGSAVEVLRSNSALALALGGNELANTLYSGAGADTLSGGAGDDVFYVNAASDRVIEAAGGGTDTVYASAAFTLGTGSAVEVLRSNSALALALGGNELANTLYSGAGADSLSGGAGDDVFYVNAASDRVIEAAGGGTDTVYASAAFTLAAGSAVEVLRSNSALALALGGNELANTLYSGVGADSLSGGAGNDTYYVNATSDRVIEASVGGVDTVYASQSFALGVGVEVLRGTGALGLQLTGNRGANKVYGTTAADTLTGGLGQDFLYGGTDRAADRFVFVSKSDSAVGALRDQISGFVTGIDDLDLRQIDANQTLSGNQTFLLASQATAYALWSVVSGSNLILRADITGDKLADMEIALIGTTNFAAGDVFL